MRVTARIERFNLVKARVANLARQDKMTNQVGFPGRGAGKPNSRLEDDARLLRNRPRTTAGAHHPRKLVENSPNVWIPAREKIIERKFPARVPHVSSGELFPALRAFPERARFFATRRFSSRALAHGFYGDGLLLIRNPKSKIRNSSHSHSIVLGGLLEMS